VTAAVLVTTGATTSLLDTSPTVHITLAALAGTRGEWAAWAAVIVVVLGVAAAAVVAGALVARAVERRPARDELRVESSHRPPRADARSAFAALLRTDRTGIWRSVPLRRGLFVLAGLPGLVAVAGSLTWETVTILPGLAASGGALLFGVNSWCLDGRGALWRESLPVSPRLVFVARAWVLCEVLLVATGVTLALAALRAGPPSPAELAAVLAVAVVVTVQVAGASLRWSVRRPYAVDLRSARATPAPPLAMVGYSARLALTTTLTALVFSVLARLDAWHLSVAFAVPFLLFSVHGLVRTSSAWSTPVTRARVVTTVAG